MAMDRPGFLSFRSVVFKMLVWLDPGARFSMSFSLFQRWRFGEPVIIVSGLPRSGTSMFMNMLQAGGVPLVTDSVRSADPDNPKGYFEMEKVKHLAEQTDKSWIRAARGKGLKVISHLLKELPPGNCYRVVFARRSLHEVIPSQNAMLARLGEPNPVEDERALELYRRHLVNLRVLVRQRSDMQMQEFDYATTINEPLAVAGRLNEFVGGHLDVGRMQTVVDRNLYRNRFEATHQEVN